MRLCAEVLRASFSTHPGPSRKLEVDPGDHAACRRQAHRRYRAALEGARVYAG